MPVWATIVSNVTENNSFLLFMTQTPTYLNDVSGLSLEALGVVAAVPYLTMAIVCQVSGYLSDVLRSRYHIQTTVVRKLFTCGAYVIQTIVLLLLANVDSVPAVMTLLTTAVGIGGFSAFTINFFDLGPQYASLTVGLANTVSALPGIITPLIISVIVKNKLAAEWHVVFYFSAGVAVFGAVFYAAFGSGEIQSWALQKTDEAASNRADESASTDVGSPAKD